MIDTTCTPTQTYNSHDSYDTLTTIVICHSDPLPLQPCAEEKQEPPPDDDLFEIERFKGPPPPHKLRIQRTYNTPLIKRRNHCNIARPRFNLPRLKRQRAMRLNTSSR